MQDNGKIIALLIDAENVSPKYIKVILDELTLYGTPAYKRIYGDWTSTDMASWKKLLLENNLTPIQQFSYTQGKNASDSAMLIDAMDILYTGNCDGFCLVSSDSDFTRLASRLRESRMFVIGMGESKTPMSFKAACDAFKYLDVLYGVKGKRKAIAEAQQTGKPEAAAKATKKQGKASASKEAKPVAAPEKPAEPSPQAEEQENAFAPLEEIIQKIRDIIDHDSDEDGYMSLAQVGSILGRLHADFDTRNYGFTKLHKLIAHTDAFDTCYDSIPGGGKNLMVKNKA